MLVAIVELVKLVRQRRITSVIKKMRAQELRDARTKCKRLRACFHMPFAQACLQDAPVRDPALAPSMQCSFELSTSGLDPEGTIVPFDSETASRPKALGGMDNKRRSGSKLACAQHFGSLCL